MERKFSGDNVISGLFWRFSERFGAQIVTFIVTIILARILDPTVYGTIALVTVFITLFQVFIDSGLGQALIQKKDADDLDFSTVFYTNIVFCLALYTILFFTAPLVSKFYNEPVLTPAIRVLGIQLIVASLKNIQQSYVSRHLLFKKFFFATLAGTIGAAVIGIWMALNGYGVWALIAQHLFNTTVDTIILWFTVKWRPKWMFSFERLKTLFSFGVRVLGSSLIQTMYREIRQLMIGKLDSPDALAFYNKGKRFPYIIIKNISTSINSVMFPTMSSIQDEKEKLKRVTKLSNKLSAYIIVPMMMGMAVTCEPMIDLLLTSKWMPVVPFIRVYCALFAMDPLMNLLLEGIKSTGQSKTYFRITVITKVLETCILFGTMWFGPMVISYGELIYYPIAIGISIFYVRKLIGYGFKEIFLDFIPYVLMSAVMGAIVFPIEFIGFNDIVTLVIQILVGIGVYILESIILKEKMFYYMLEKVKHLIGKRKKKN